MAFVRIPKSNTLRMVRIDNQTGTLQNFDNRLQYQEDYSDYLPHASAQLISSADTILIQFQTDLGAPVAEVYDNLGNLAADKSADITPVLTSTNFTVYNLSFTVANQGYYYLKLNFGSGQQIYRSEIFQIDGFDLLQTVKLEYNTSEIDGIVYGNSESFVIRCKGRLAEMLPEMEKEATTSFNQSPITLKAWPLRKAVLEIGAVPRYMIEKINLALAHEVFKVNDVAYESEGAVDASFVREGVDITNLYSGQVELQQADYENYPTIAEDEEPTIYPIYIDFNQNRLLFVQNSITFYAKYRD